MPWCITIWPSILTVFWSYQDREHMQHKIHDGKGELQTFVSFFCVVLFKGSVSNIEMLQHSWSVPMSQCTDLRSICTVICMLCTYSRINRITWYELCCNIGSQLYGYVTKSQDVNSETQHGIMYGVRKMLAVYIALKAQTYLPYKQ